MSSSHRSISTHFWDDRYTRKLNKDEKLLYLYLITNPLTNIAGIYEITIDRIVFDTGIPEKTVLKSIERFKEDDKIIYYNDYIVMINFLKNQRLNENMRKGALKIINNLPCDISTFIFKDLSNGFESYRMVTNALLKLKGNKKEKGEIEKEALKKKLEKERLEKLKPLFDKFVSLYNKDNGKAEAKKIFMKLDKSDIDKILDHVPDYVKSTPDKTYRKNMNNYLKNECWNDEIIIRKEPEEEIMEF